jgi:hypothetical protein
VNIHRGESQWLPPYSRGPQDQSIAGLLGTKPTQIPQPGHPAATGQSPNVQAVQLSGLLGDRSVTANWWALDLWD